MKITDVTVQLVDSGNQRRKWTHVRVETDEGIVGIGEATFTGRETVVAEMVRSLRHLVIGKDPFNSEQMYLDLYVPGFAGYRSGGIMFTSAISGIDQALWDIKGKAFGAPVSALLGGPRTTRVPVYAHFDGDTIEARIEDAQRRITEGFTAIKSNTTLWIAPGPRVSREELRRIDAAYDAYRRALGEEVELMDDAHAAWHPSSALEVARTLEPYRLLFLEEPTIPEDPEGYARIRRGTTTTIAGSERITTKYRYAEFLRAGAVDVAQPDIVYIGGITEMKKVATIAELHQVVLAPHNTKGPIGIMASAHVMASIPNGLIQEFVTPTWVPVRSEILAEPLDIEGGRLLVRDRPGLGIEFDDVALAKHII